MSFDNQNILFKIHLILFHVCKNDRVPPSVSLEFMTAIAKEDRMDHVLLPHMGCHTTHTHTWTRQMGYLTLLPQAYGKASTVLCEISLKLKAVKVDRYFYIPACNTLSSFLI